MVASPHVSCRAKVRMANKVYNISKELMSEEGVTTRIKTQIPRTWYIALANCDDAPRPGSGTTDWREGVALSNFEIVWKNGDSHVPKDEQGIKQMCGFMMFALILFIGGTAFLYVRLKSDADDLAHQVMLILIVAASVHLLSVLLNLMHHGKYAKDGMGSPGLANTALGVGLIPPIILVSLFLSVAKGKYITTESLRNEVRTIFEIVMLYLVASIALLVWAVLSVDHTKYYGTYYYETEAGVCLIVLRLLSMLWFVSSLQKTFRGAEAYKRNFYVGFALFGALWFASSPIIFLVAEATDYYHRISVLYVLEQLTLLLTYTIFVGLFGAKRDFIRKKSGADHGAIGQEDIATV
jgi:hypothetical protein